MKLEGMIDVFNVLNANNVLAAGTLTASNLDRPTVVLTPRVARVDHLVSNSFGFGGQNVSLVLGRCV